MQKENPTEVGDLLFAKLEEQADDEEDEGKQGRLHREAEGVTRVQLGGRRHAGHAAHPED